MKAPREYRKWVSWMRSKVGKKNGGIKPFFFDNPKMEIFLDRYQKLKEKIIKMNIDFSVYF